MSNTTNIEWVRGAKGERGRTYNPIRGCTRISPGCGGGGSFAGPEGRRGGCYAEGIAARFSGEGQPFEGFAVMTDNGPRWTGKVALLQDKLDEPLRVRAPTTWFVSMSDVFHESLTNEEIAMVFAVMALATWHTFQILTKRSKRMAAWFAWAAGGRHVWEAAQKIKMPRGKDKSAPGWPLPNVHIGVSIELAAYKHRLDDLRACPAVVKFCSLEPLLGDLGTIDFSGIHQAIAGSESGVYARRMHEDWVRSIRDQATAQRTAFFFKQRLDDKGHKVSLPILDGRIWDEMPVRVPQAVAIPST